MDSVARDHLFINYATEDAVFADWLALRLASEGYRVWYDRIKLLGGESYPKDIDDAITTRVFRMIAVLTRRSIHKPTPLKERTLALNLARERNAEVVIPLKLEQLSPSELGHQLSDLTFISFDRSWASGFASILKKLQSVDCPRESAAGRARVGRWLAETECVKASPERLWSNLFPLRSIPERVHLFALRRKEAFQDADRRWPVAREDETHVWAFAPPEEGLGIDARPSERSFLWKEKREILGRPTSAIVSNLIRRTVELDSIRRQLRPVPDKHQVYFPSGVLLGDWLTFRSYDEEKSRVQVVGERTHKLSDGTRSRTVYSLAFGVRPILKAFGEPVLRLSVTAYFMDAEGKGLSSGLAGRKRRVLGKSWWNHEWLVRTLACGSWITNAQEERSLLNTSSGNLVVGRRPLTYSFPWSVDESVLGATEEEQPEDEIEDSESEEEESDSSEEP
jgi:hypothetical protein